MQLVPALPIPQKEIPLTAAVWETPLHEKLLYTIEIPPITSVLEASKEKHWYCLGLRNEYLYYQDNEPICKGVPEPRGPMINPTFHYNKT